jgi:hypothetical protein
VDHDPYNTQHRSSSRVTGKLAVVTADVTPETEAAIAKVQALARGSLARSRLSPGKRQPDADTDPAGGDAAAPRKPGEESSIFSAETTIRACLRAIEGTHAAPDILAKFQTVDTRHTGFVKREQFAFVMSQVPVSGPI